MSGGLNAAAEVDPRLMRALLRAGRANALAQDWLDAAEIALASNKREMAATLYGLVILRVGLSPTSLALLHSVNARVPLWTTLPRKPEGSVGGFSVDIAIGELKRLQRFSPNLQPSFDALSPRVIREGGLSGRTPDPRKIALAERVAAAVREIPQVAASGGLANLLLSFGSEVVELPPIAIDEYADSSVEILALLLALEGTRRFLVANYDLLQATPVGLFDAAAALEPGGLGPFFSNVGMLLRSMSDLFALIDAAADGGADVQMLERWAILLSAHFPESRLTDLAAELGDRGMAQALHRLLARIARGSADARPFSVLDGIRDAALDIDAFLVAGDAQQLIALWRRVNAKEWQRLGEIRAYGGDFARARDALQQALRFEPSDADASVRLALIERGGPIPFEEAKIARRRLRRARLAAFRAN